MPVGACPLVPTPIGTITRAATRRAEPLNVILFPTHEAWETGLARTGHQFYAVRAPSVKDWDRAYRPVPDNYTLLNGAKGPQQLPVEIDFDVVLVQNKLNGQYQIGRDFARQFHLPMVVLEHCLPPPNWGPGQIAGMKELRGDINVFISEYSRTAWGWEDEALVIHHGVDTDLFSPGASERSPHALSVVNDWKNRDWCCGFSLWQEATKWLPVKVVGKTPGLSEPAASLEALIDCYREARIFLNTSLVSPVPTSLLEAMSCGCAIVSTATCMIPDFIQHGVNGLLANDAKGLRSHVKTLLEDSELAAKLGRAAWATIEERFGLSKFVNNWRAVLGAAASLTYTGG